MNCVLVKINQIDPHVRHFFDRSLYNLHFQYERMFRAQSEIQY